MNINSNVISTIYLEISIVFNFNINVVMFEDNLKYTVKDNNLFDMEVFGVCLQS